MGTRLYDSSTVPLQPDLIEMDLEIDLLVTAWVAGKNCFFQAEPGVAKTLLARVMAEVIDKKFFRKQMNQFTPPEKLLGYDDMYKLMKEGLREYITADFLPEAEFALLDELFETGKPCMDPMLTYLNEGIYETPKPMQGKTRCVVSASNVIPTGKAMQSVAAFWDRFHIRHQVPRLRGQVVVDIMKSSNNRDERGGGLNVTPRNFDKEVAERKFVKVPDLVYECALNMQNAVEKKGMVVSNRRMCDLIHISKAVAIIQGRTTVDVKDLRIAKWMFWNNLDEISTVADTIGSMLDPVGAEIEKHFNAALQVQNEAREVSFDENDPESLKDKRRFFSAKNKSLKGIRTKLAEVAKLSGDSRVSEAVSRIDEIQREFYEFLIEDIKGNGEV